MLKKIAAAIFACFMVIVCFSGCGTDKIRDKKINVVCTMFPQYDWVREIIGEDADNINLTLLLDGGTDFHSYQPTAADIITVSESDLFIYAGGESDSWVDEVLGAAKSSPVKSINMMEVIGDAAVEEEAVSGMQQEETHEHDEKEYDEHVWLSLKNADTICTAIKDALSELDPKNSDKYSSNCGVYRQSLAVLHSEYEQTVGTAARKVLLFADRFPFRYLTEDYNLTYYAAFSGCSAETEASFETISFLAKMVDENKLPVILITETSDGTIAKTVKSSTAEMNQKILVMDAMQSVTKNKISEGMSYLETMKNNLSVLSEALN